MPKDNQFKDDISPSLYEEICQSNLKLLRKLDSLNLSQQILLEENVKLKNDLDNLNNNLEIIEIEVDSLEEIFRTLNKPLNINLELTNFSIPTISLLVLLFVSLLKHFLILKEINKELKLSF